MLLTADLLKLEAWRGYWQAAWGAENAGPENAGPENTVFLAAFKWTCTNTPVSCMRLNHCRNCVSIPLGAAFLDCSYCFA